MTNILPDVTNVPKLQLKRHPSCRPPQAPPPEAPPAAAAAAAPSAARSAAAAAASILLFVVSERLLLDLVRLVVPAAVSGLDGGSVRSG